MAIRAAVGVKSRHFGLRLILAPVLLICAIAWWNPFERRVGLTLLPTSGEVRVGAAMLSPGAENYELERGDWCHVPAEASALLLGPDIEIQVQADSYFLVEEPLPSRLRLKVGALELSGDCVVTSTWGVLELVDAQARFELVKGGYELHCLDGEIAWTGPAGQRLLRAGESLVSDDLIGMASR
jgi:hypothetical protein